MRTLPSQRPQRRTVGLRKRNDDYRVPVGHVVPRRQYGGYQPSLDAPGDWTRYRGDPPERPVWMQRLIALGALFLIVVLSSLGEAPR